MRPWNRCDWSGRWVSVKECPAGEIEETDVAQYLVDATEGDRWDGNSACIVRLQDGRYAAWECWYGPTGDGFNRDAYGGDTDVWFASDPREFYGYFSDSARSMMQRAGYALEPMPALTESIAGLTAIRDAMPERE